MNSTEPERPQSLLWVSHISPENSKWLAENLEEADKSVKAMMELIEKEPSERMSKLIDLAEGLHCVHKRLAERYDHLTEELRKYLPSLLQVQNSLISPSVCGQDSLATPHYKSARNKFGPQSVGFDLFLSSGGSSDLSVKGSSDLSVKEGSESSSLGSDSESESFDSSINKHSNFHVMVDVKGLSGTKEKVKVTKNEIADNEVEMQENWDFAALLKGITVYEKELEESSKKLQLSEEEIARLKAEFNMKEAFTMLISDLKAQLESAQRVIKMREAELEMEKGRVLILQKEVAELGTQVSDSSGKIETLVGELEIVRKKLKVSEDESNEISDCTHQLQSQLALAQKDTATLEAKLESEKMQVLELQQTIVKHMADVSQHDQEIKELNFTSSNARKAFSLDKMKLQSDISVLSEQLTLSQARAVESELRSKLLENELRRSEVVKMEMKCLHDAQQIGLCNEIEQLKANVAERSEIVEALNKKIDMLKLKYDRLVAEKDGLNAKVQMLNAEMVSRDNQNQQLEENIRQMHVECVELIIGSESAKELIDELRLRLGELEKEVERQRIVISDRAEEKREAIRQLCFSLEHYRNGYQELRQAFIGHRRHAILAF